MDSDKLNIPGPHIRLFNRDSFDTGYQLASCSGD